MPVSSVPTSKKSLLEERSGTAAWTSAAIALLALGISIWSMAQSEQKAAADLIESRTAEARAIAQDTRVAMQATQIATDQNRAIAIATDTARQVQTIEARAGAAETRATAQEERVMASRIPNVDVGHQIFDTPNVMGTNDIVRLTRSNLQLQPISSAYSESLIREPGGPDTKYLFVVFHNKGPGIAQKVEVTNLTWEPKEGQSRPPGLPEFFSFESLEPDTLFVLLVDAAEEIDLLEPIRDSHAAKICVTYRYFDVDGNGYLGNSDSPGDPVCLPKSEADIATPTVKATATATLIAPDSTATTMIPERTQTPRVRKELPTPVGSDNTAETPSPTPTSGWSWTEPVPVGKTPVVMMRTPPPLERPTVGLP